MDNLNAQENNELFSTKEYNILYNLYNEAISAGYTEDEISMSIYYTYTNPLSIDGILYSINDIRDLIRVNSKR